MQTNYFKVMVPNEEARFGTLPATPWNLTGHLRTLQATLSNVNSKLTRFGTSPVFPLLLFHSQGTIHSMSTSRIEEPPTESTLSWSRGDLVNDFVLDVLTIAFKANYRMDTSGVFGSPEEL